MSLKWYTRARRFPQMIGRTPDGTRIWGGPYTYTQVGVAVAVAALLSRTTWLWARGSLPFNTALFLALCVAAVILTGKLPPGLRNPVVLASGGINLLTTGYQVDGRGLRTKKIRLGPTSPVVIYESTSPITVPDPEPLPAAIEGESSPAPRLRRRLRGRGNGLVQPPATLSNVQRLLLGEKT